MKLKFTWNNDGNSIEQYPVAVNHFYGKFWRNGMIFNLSDDVANSWNLNGAMLMRLSIEDYEKSFIEKLSNVMKKDNASPNSLSSLHVQKSVLTTNFKEIQLNEVKKSDTNGLSSSGISLL